MMRAAIVATLALACLPAGADPSVTVKDVGGCSHALPWTKDSEVRAVGREGGELVVSVLANAACGGVVPLAPNVQVSDNAVALSWKWVKAGDAPLAACKCTRHLEFRVSGAPEGDVTVTAKGSW